MFATLPPSAMRMELTRLVSGRLEVPESVVERELSVQGAGGGAAASNNESRVPTTTATPTTATKRHATQRQVGGGLGRREETERTFLVLCLALPPRGSAGTRGAGPGRSLH